MERWRLSPFGKLFGAGLWCLAVSACSEGNEPDAGDAGVVEQDASLPADSGVRAKCPIPENSPVCQKPEDCGDDGSKPSACAYCPTYNENLCALGACSLPVQAGPHTLRFDTVDVIGLIGSFAGLVVDTETTGGETLSCAQVYARQVSWDEPCYNIVDVSYARPGGAVGTVYPMLFNGFASGRKLLFIVYAFEMEGAAGTPKAVSCTERQVPEGAGTVEVEGDKMRVLQ
ncbi:MAG: hypothetical protein IPG45_21240 [Deltaproteobacteria bacterium]|jgi:hypothetical protein|nr:hypothetical protein [Deltaproteobacteria bacterium]